MFDIFSLMFYFIHNRFVRRIYLYAGPRLFMFARAKFRIERKTATVGVGGGLLLLLRRRRRRWRDGGRHWHNLPPSRRRNWLKCKCCDYVSRSYRGLAAAARRRIAPVRSVHVPSTTALTLRPITPCYCVCVCT